VDANAGHVFATNPASRLIDALHQRFEMLVLHLFAPICSMIARTVWRPWQTSKKNTIVISIALIDEWSEGRGDRAVDGEAGCGESLARSAEIFDLAGQELGELVVRLNRLAKIAALRELAMGDRPDITSEAVRSIIAARRLRAEHLGQGIGEAAWAILLEVFAARLEGRRIAMTDLGTAARFPQTTAYEWIRRLIDRGLLLRLPDPNDERIALIDLSDDAAERMRAYLTAALRLSPWIL
jgi:DNA-binding MarR family transcriptional regulator